MAKILILAYGVFMYFWMFALILYMVGFVGGVNILKNIDWGVYAVKSGSMAEAALIDVALILFFGVTHSVMARPAFKAQLTKFIPAVAERSTYVLVTNVALTLLYVLWRPIDTIIWSSNTVVGWILFGVSMIGWWIALWSTFLIDHFDLFGLRQVWLNYEGKEYTPPPFAIRGLYKYVRNPLMLGFLIAFWFTPTMTLGHLLFSVAMTVYIFIGVHYEERDLEKSLGEDYLRYKRQTSLVFPWPKR
jgi:methanethiol S-methyltransferase